MGAYTSCCGDDGAKDGPRARAVGSLTQAGPPLRVTTPAAVRRRENILRGGEDARDYDWASGGILLDDEGDGDDVDILQKNVISAKRTR